MVSFQQAVRIIGTRRSSARMLGVLIVLLFGGRCLLAQEPPTTQTPVLSDEQRWHFEYSIFKYVLRRRGLEVVERLDDALPERAKTVIVSLGSQDPGNLLRKLRLRVGECPLLIASDSPCVLPRYFRIRRGPVTSSISSDRYMGHADCLILRNLDTKDEVVGGIGELIINRGGWLEELKDQDGRWEIHLRYPSEVQPRGSQSQPLFASWRSAADGRQAPFFLLADQSLLSNGMLWHGENMLLAIQLADALAEQGQSQVLFLVDNQAQSEAADLPDLPPLDAPDAEENEPIEPPFQPDLKSMLELANRVVGKVEDADLLNEALVNQPRGMRTPYFRRMLWIATTLFLLALAVYLFTLDPSAPSSRSRSIRGQIATPPVLDTHPSESPEQRGLAAQGLIRDFFRQWTGSKDPFVWKQAIEKQKIASPESLSEKGSDPLRHGPKTNEIDLSPKGQTPFRRGSETGQGTDLTHLYHLATLETSPPMSREKFLALGREVLCYQHHEVFTK